MVYPAEAKVSGLLSWQETGLSTLFKRVRSLLYQGNERLQTKVCPAAQRQQSLLDPTAERLLTKIYPVKLETHYSQSD